jgi:transcriptional regulator with AAA-type ATPase domain
MAFPKTEIVYITWHYTTHGIAYLKHVLSAFYCRAVELQGDNLKGARDLSQIDMTRVFDTSPKQGFVFDHVYYLTAPQETFDKLSTRRFRHREGIFEDEEIIQADTQTVWQDVIKLKLQQQGNHLFDELAYVKKTYPQRYDHFFAQVWRDMQHYPIDEQIKWFVEISNAAPLYARRFHPVKLTIKDLRNEQEITRQVLEWLRTLSNKHPHAHFVINVSLGSNETQVAWFILGDANCLPDNTIFIKTADDKLSEPNHRFKRFSITAVPVKIISEITRQTVKLYEKTSAPQRRLAALKWDSYIKQGFSILLLGERGTGKSRIVEEKTNGNLIPADCAAFEDDAKAEAELFGYEKGAFTGADKAKDGLFHAAKNKVLFLDEVHNLSKRVQAKLMKALQTDENNRFKIRRLGATQAENIQSTVIFASNRDIDELKHCLLPDFFDRIAQLIITFPPLRDTPEERIKDWQDVWQQLKFPQPVPMDKHFLNWLEQQPLYGNFRDLQKIAIYYKSFLDFNDELKQLIGIHSAFEYTRKEFDAYHASFAGAEKHALFADGKTAKDMERDFRQALVRWAEKYYGGKQKQLAEKLGITVKTLTNWKNGISHERSH